jgi:hypothetical protein
MTTTQNTPAAATIRAAADLLTREHPSLTLDRTEIRDALRQVCPPRAGDGPHWWADSCLGLIVANTPLGEYETAERAAAAMRELADRLTMG